MYGSGGEYPEVSNGIPPVGVVGVNGRKNVAGGKSFGSDMTILGTS